MSFSGFIDYSPQITLKNISERYALYQTSLLNNVFSQAGYREVLEALALLYLIIRTEQRRRAQRGTIECHVLPVCRAHYKCFFEFSRALIQ